MLEKLNEIEKAALSSLAAAQDTAALDAWRLGNLGRNSPLMQVFSALPTLPKEERPAFGQAANRVKLALEAALAARSAEIRRRDLEQSLGETRLDVTLPGRPIHRGRLHPSTQQLRRVLAILAEMGFQVYTSPEVETDEINFQLLNFPPHHPAREMQDSLYIEAPRSRRQSPAPAHPHLARADPRHARVLRRRSKESARPFASPCPACASATSRSRRAPRCSSTRWKAWPSGATSPSATSRAR